ncbi:MAG: transaldolase [Thermoplasmata archaeon]|nr:MAG: transaldolase [Thermoplasmata archaeon]
MKIFIDTADLDEIKRAYSWGIVDGVTTNPSLIKKAVDKLKREGKTISMEDYIKEICLAVDGPVSLEVKGVKSEEIIKEAEILYEKFNPTNNNVVVKVPVNTSMGDDEDFEGIKAIKHLEKKGIPTNATLVMTAEQALMAAKAGASYVSPFLGRIDDYIRKNLGIEFEKGDYYNFSIMKKIEERKMNEEIGNESPANLYQKLKNLELNDNGIYSGVELTESIIKIYRAYNFKTKIIAASIRNARQVREVAELGVDIATIPFSVIKEMMRHYKTMEGMKKFVQDVVPEYRALFGQ